VTATLDQLRAAADDAAARRALSADPAVVALAVERVRSALTATMYVGIAIALAFTTVAVQGWGARVSGAEAHTAVWWSMWGLSLLVELPLVAILIGEQIAGRYDVKPAAWVRRARWSLIGFAYLMNTFEPWSLVLGGSWGFGSLMLHSIPPVVILLASEALTGMRTMLADTVTAAAAAAATVTDRRKAPAPKVRKPTEKAPAPEKTQDVEQPPPPDEIRAAGRKRQIGVGWALTHWREDLNSADIVEGLLAEGIEVSRGEAWRCLNEARRQRGELHDTSGEESTG